MSALLAHRGGQRGQRAGRILQGRGQLLGDPALGRGEDLVLVGDQLDLTDMARQAARKYLAERGSE